MSRQFEDQNRPGLRQRIEEHNQRKREEAERLRQEALKNLEKDNHVDGY
jgi:uncharacterized membrane protein